MIQTVAVASLIAASSWVVVPSPGAFGVQSVAHACRHAPAVRMQEVAEGATPAPAEDEPIADFTEDLLEALALDDSPLSEMDAAPVFVKNEDAPMLEPLTSYVNALTVEAAREKYRLHENDSGSSQVQIAELTARIQYMTKHMQENKKDYSSLRGLNRMVTKRRKLLEYLLREDFGEFKRITGELGIRTNQLLKPKLAGARGRRV